jgi:hypothetical protein
MAMKPTANCIFHIAVILLHKILQKNSVEVAYSSKFYYHIQIKDPVFRSINVLQPHKLVPPSCWYYLLGEVKIYEFGVASNGTVSIQNFIEIRPTLPGLKRSLLETRPDLCALFRLHREMHKIG